MLFNSWQFLIFLVIVFALYWTIPSRFRWCVLLLSSCWFYMSAGAKYILLLFMVTLISYFAALTFSKVHSEKQKRAVLIVSVLLCLAGLLVIKYLNFLLTAITQGCALFTIPLHFSTLKLVLPLGISFYTFNIISYIVDVYKEKITAERHFGIYAAYIFFFPKMLAGPIERADRVIPQIRAEYSFDAECGIDGLKRMLWGFFKKIVVADTLAIYVDTVFNQITSHTGFALVLAALFFSLQIYCDFSGYSDIALGTAELFGFHLMENFQSPYFSSSIQEFWRKWHISLSTWFRDYVYIPLGGNRVSKPRQYWNLMVTFLTSGLWHGANWTFVLWGGLHGAVQILEKLLGIRTYKKRNILWLIRCMIVFLFATAAWVFFRADTIGDAFYLFVNQFDGIRSPAAYLKTGFDQIGMTFGALVTFVVYMIPLCGYDLASGVRNRDAREVLAEKPAWFQWCFYLMIGLIVVFLSQKGIASEFVYMNF